jgi:phage gp36-like protein
MAYQTLAQFKDRTNLPAEFVDAVEAARPGWIAVQLGLASAWIDARLSKRYAVPFAAPVPEIVLAWVTRIVTFEVWQRRGYDPADLSMERAAKDADDARAEVKEAADSNVGMFELPLRQDTSEVAVMRGGPFYYAESSPYVWADGQAETGRVEDGNRRGSGS